MEKSVKRDILIYYPIIYSLKVGENISTPISKLAKSILKTFQMKNMQY
jgi:hypothetical protein